MEKKYATLSKKTNIGNEKDLKPEKNITMGKSKQVFTTMKYQKKALNVFIYQ